MLRKILPNNLPPKFEIVDFHSDESRDRKKSSEKQTQLLLLLGGSSQLLMVIMTKSAIYVIFWKSNC